MKINIRLKKDVPPALIAKLQEELGEYTFAWKEDIPTLTVSVFQKRKTIEVLKKLELLDDSMNSERRRQDLYRGRYGILFGFLLFFFVLFLSGERVWTVEVKGNDLVSEERILKMLEIEGIYPGASGNVSYPALASNCVANNPEISWMSIGRHGTTVTCVVMEAKAEEQEDLSDGANLRAAKDATVLEINVSRGKPMITVGQTVRKGDLLVSGVITGVQGTFALEARGTVVGQVTEIIREKIPLEVVRREYFETEIAEETIIFFGFPIKIWKNSGNSPIKYDTIDKKEPLYLLGKPLPIYLTQKLRLPYVTRSEKISQEAAQRIALGLLNERISLLTENGELVEKHFDFKVENGFLLAECTVSYICPISEQVPFRFGSHVS